MKGEVTEYSISRGLQRGAGILPASPLRAGFLSALRAPKKPARRQARRQNGGPTSVRKTDKHLMPGAIWNTSRLGVARRVITSIKPDRLRYQGTCVKKP